MKRHNSKRADRMEIRRQASQDCGMIFSFGVVGVLILALLLAFAMGTVYAGQGAIRALEFDGKNDYVEAGGYDIDIFSISAWVKLPEQVDDWVVIVDFTPEGTQNRRGLILSGKEALGDPDIGSPAIVYGANNYRTSADGDIDGDDSWHHIAGTYNGSVPKLYVDGKSVSSLYPADSAGQGPSDSRLTIGTWTDTTPETYCFPGIIDEVCVWDTALEQADILELMHKRVPDDHPYWGNLIGYWRFDEPKSDSLLCADASDSGNDGTMTGMEPFDDRITSTAPIATDTVANKADMTVVWHKDEWNSSAELAVDARDRINDPNYAIFAHNDGELTANTSNKPGGIDRRWNRVWTFDACAEDGDMIADFIFFVPEGQITNKESMVLLESDSDTDFSGAIEVGTPVTSGALTEMQFTDVSITDGMSYTIGSITSDNPLPIGLSSFKATITIDGVFISWRTEAESDNIGFNLYRSDTEDGKYTKINTKLIQGAGTDANPNDYLFTDKDVELGKTYFYYLEDIDIAGAKSKSEAIKAETVDVVVTHRKVFEPMNEFRLMQNYPNPFNPETWIPYELPTDATVIIRIYDVNGHLVRHLGLGKQKAGIYVYKKKAAYWDGTDQTGQSVSSGLYFYTLEAGDFQAAKRMIIVK